MQSNEFRWLQCEVAPGMFPTERRVRFHIEHAEPEKPLDLFVDNEFVHESGEVRRGHLVPGRFRVYLVREEGDRAIVRLPAETVMHGYLVKVSVSQLSHH